MPTTWQELLTLSDQIVKDGGTPWCIENGFFGGGGAGYAATWWISDFLLRTAPATDYYWWINGDINFNSPQVKQAIQIMSDIWFKPGYVYGGRQSLNKTSTWDVAWYMFDDPPRCWLMKEPTWTVTYDGHGTYTAFTRKVFKTDYDFFLLPPIDPNYGAPIQVEGVITAMFHDRPEVRALLEYLTTGDQLEYWIAWGIPFGFSPHKNAKPDWSNNLRERAIAEVIQAAQQAGSLHFTASDLMWPEVQKQFHASMTAYIAGDIDLDTALNQVDAVVVSNSTP